MQYSINFWNDFHYKNFEKIAVHCRMKQKPVEILEIGTFEGRTAFWFLDNIPNAKVTSIDPEVGPNFRHNFTEWAKDNEQTKFTRFNWKCEYSFRALLAEIAAGKQYDFIYVDGCHNACCILEDAILSWKVLKTKGILLFDDYQMEISDNWFYIMHKEFTTEKRYGLMFQHPKSAIDSFLALYKGQYEMYIDNYQIGVIKFAELDKINLNYGDETQKAIYEKNEGTTK